MFQTFTRGRAAARTLAAFLFSLGAALAGVPLSASPAGAHSIEHGDLQIIHPWARPVARAGGNGAGFLAIANEGGAPDRLLAVESDVAARVELHTTAHDGAVARMRALPEGVAVPPDDVATLMPGGDHVMFMGLKTPLAEGDMFGAVLVFEKAGRVPVRFMVESAGMH